LTQKAIAKLIQIKKGRISHYENGHRHPTINIFLKWIDVLKISKKSIESHIIIFNYPKINFILNKFPYKEMPEHAEIIAHTLFDGTVGRGNSFYYETRNNMEQEMFSDLVKKIGMGTALYHSNQNGVKSYGLSSVASNLLINHYGFERRKLPKKIIALALKNPSWKNSILRACFIDEGSNGKIKLKDNILVASSLKNEILAKQIVQLLKNNYSHKLCIYHKRNEFSILLHNKSLTDFYNNTLKDIEYECYYKKVNTQRMICRLQPSKFRW